MEPIQDIEKKANHQARIVKIDELIPHNNADNLELILIEGYQVVVRKGDFKPGDLGVYIQPDSVVPQSEPFRFIWEPVIQFFTSQPGLEHLDPTKGITTDKQRRITVRKFRGQWSEGLLLPVTDFWNIKNGVLTPGDDVSDLLGVTHYDPEIQLAGTGTNAAAPRTKRRYPKTLKGWFFFLLHRLGFKRDERNFSETVSLGIPTYDVNSLKNYPDVFQDGEEVVVTEKIHGSNARFVYFDGVQYAGSRNLWKSPGSGCKWRQALIDVPEIGDYCKDNPGYTLYGEITPTQGGYDYGTEKNEVRFFLFDIRKSDGIWMEHDEVGMVATGTAQNGAFDFVDKVPALYRGPYSKAKIDSLLSGPSMVRGAKHIREGVVIKAVPERRIPQLGRVQLKVVSNEFLAKDSK